MKETIEKVVIVIAIIVVVIVARLYFDREINKANEEKSRIELLEISALKADSLEVAASIYDIPNPHLDVELDADVRELYKYLKQNLSTDSLEKVVMIATPIESNKLHWHIKIENK